MNAILIRSCILLSSALIALSCKDSPTEYFPLNNSIIGNWNWVDSKEVYPPGYFTPESTGHSKGYCFSSDGTYIRFLDSQNAGNGHYTITDKEHLPTYKKLITFIDSTKTYNEHYYFDIVNEDTLLLHRAATDAGLDRYVREK